MWPEKNKYLTSGHYLEGVSAVNETNEHEPLLHFNASINDHSRSPRNQWNKFSIIVALIGIAYILFYSVLESIYIYVPSSNTNQFSTFLYTLFFIGNIFRIVVIIKCFYGMSTQLKPKCCKSSNISLNHVIIIISSVATCGYYFKEIPKLSLYMSVFHLIHCVVRNMYTILQTLLILQMKYYEKIGPQSHFCSIQNTFLFISLVNLGVWISYTFMKPRFVHQELKYKTYASFLDSMWFPFVIFYPFESFIAFYRFFRA